MNRNNFDDDYRYNTDDRYGDVPQGYSEINYNAQQGQYGNSNQWSMPQSQYGYNNQWNMPQRNGGYDLGSREARLADLCRQHPDVRIATAKDGRFQLMFMGIFGLVFVIGGILVFIFTVQEGEVTKDFFAHAESVSGTLLSSHSRKVGKKHRTTVYDVTYAYRYNDMEYMGQETLSSSEARSLSVTEASSSGNNIIVYVDTRNPSSSRVYHGSGEPLYFILIFPVIGVAVVIWGIHEYQNCKKGKVAVYKRRGKTVFVNIGR